MVPPNGVWRARSWSTWIHWWSPVTSAKVFTSFCVTSCQSETPRSSPSACLSSSSPVIVRMAADHNRIEGAGAPVAARAAALILPRHVAAALGGVRATRILPRHVAAAAARRRAAPPLPRVLRAAGQHQGRRRAAGERAAGLGQPAHVVRGPLRATRRRVLLRAGFGRLPHGGLSLLPRA